jgi:hypothetical protein
VLRQARTAFLWLFILAAVIAAAGGRMVTSAATIVPVRPAPTPVVGPSGDFLSLAAQGPALGVCVMANDVASIPEEIGYDRSIGPGEGHRLFQPRSQPAPRALVVSRSLLEAVRHPATGPVGDDGSPEYYVLLGVLWNGHILVALDSSSLLIAQKLGLAGITPPFDTSNGLLPTDPMTNTATALAYTPATGYLVSVIGGHATASRSVAGGWLSPTKGYDRVNPMIERLQARLLASAVAEP